MFSHLRFGHDPANKAKVFFRKMQNDDLVTSAVIGLHYGERTYVKGRNLDVRYKKLRAITFWLRPHLFVINLKK